MCDNDNDYAYIFRDEFKHTRKDIAGCTAQSHSQQHHSQIVGSDAPDRPGLTSSAGGSAGSGHSGFGGFGAKPATNPNGKNLGVEGSAGSGHSGFGGFGAKPATNPNGKNLGVEGSAGSGHSGFGAKPATNPNGKNLGVEGSAGSGHSGFGAKPAKQPEPPKNTFDPFPRFFLGSFKGNEKGQQIHDLTTGDDSQEQETKKVVHKRKVVSDGTGSCEKKKKESNGPPKMGGQRLFQHVFRWVADSTGKTNVTKTSDDANTIWESIADRRDFFTDVASEFREHCITKNATTPKDFEDKRNAFCRSLSGIENITCTEVGKWKRVGYKHLFPS